MCTGANQLFGKSSLERGMVHLNINLGSLIFERLVPFKVLIQHSTIEIHVVTTTSKKVGSDKLTSKVKWKAFPLFALKEPSEMLFTFWNDRLFLPLPKVMFPFFAIFQEN